MKEKTTERQGGQVVWLCWCACGEEVLVTAYMLMRGKTKSCGCLRREMGIARGKASRRHGEGSNGRETPEYRCWANMKSRCQNPNHRLYAGYGGRGITVCAYWQTYEPFLADMGRRPSDKHSLDRIDNTGNYTPENCRWATDKVQNRNVRTNNRIEIDDETRTLAEWLETAAISRRTYYRRIAVGMTPVQALNDTPHKGRRLMHR